jgi:EAL domain-containing protein (putative c-di-GMP-specific phosphodiesterase class I)
MDDQLMALDMFTRLRMKGFRVSIDDFGIGNSSLGLLARLPFSEIKVDKSFAMTAVKSDESKAIIKSTVDLSHNLGLCVVTEGVEDRETLDFLQEVGCDYAQGYYIARPMAEAAVGQWIVQHMRNHPSASPVP